MNDTYFFLLIWSKSKPNDKLSSFRWMYTKILRSIYRFGIIIWLYLVSNQHQKKYLPTNHWIVRHHDLSRSLIHSHQLHWWVIIVWRHIFVYWFIYLFIFLPFWMFSNFSLINLLAALVSGQRICIYIHGNNKNASLYSIWAYSFGFLCFDRF